MILAISITSRTGSTISILVRGTMNHPSPNSSRLRTWSPAHADSVEWCS